jgi:hypothetical protein
LAPVVRLVLARTRCRVDEIGGPAQPLAPPHGVHPDPNALVDHSLLDLVQHNQRGLIRYAPHAIDVAHLIAQVACAWPEHAIAVVASRADQAKHLAQTLGGVLPAVRVVTDEDRPLSPERVVVTTDAGLCHVTSSPAPGAPNECRSTFDIVIALDAPEIVSGCALPWLATASNVRLYGLVTLDAKQTRLKDALMRAVFGFAEAVIPAHGYRMRPTCVVHFSIGNEKAGPPTSSGSIYATPSTGWRSVALQPELVQIVTAFCENRRAELVELLPGIERVLSEPCPPRVLVMAEYMKQALALAHRIPDLSLLVDPEALVDCPTDDVQGLRHLPGPLRANTVHAVTTIGALGACDLGRFDVVIRADRRLELPQQGARSLAEPDIGAPRPLVIVDCGRLNYMTTVSGIEARQQLHDALVWPAPGRNPLMCNVRRFIATRPRGRTR